MALERRQLIARHARSLLLAGAVLLTIVHCLRFRDFTVDDAAISYAYSQSFAHGQGLVAGAGGERVEGYSNFLWVIVVGGFVALFGHVTIVAKVLGLLLAIAVTIGSAELLAALRRRRSTLDALPAALCAAFTPIPYWSMSGLENPLYLALTVWACVRLVREAHDPALRPWSALLTAGIALTRPDGLVVVVAAALVQLSSRHRARRVWLWLAVAAAPIAAHLAWRYAYYAYPWPNTYYVKAAVPFKPGELVSLHSKGWEYLVAFGTRYRLGVVLLLAPLSLLARDRRARGIVLFVVGAVAFFPIYARGDWMSEGRFAVGPMPLLFVLAVDGIENVARLARRLPGAARSGVMVGVLLTLLLGGVIVPKALEVSGARVHHYPVPVEYVAKRARRYRELAAALEVARPSVADGDAGGNLMYAGMPLVDIGWLNDATLAHWGRHPGFVREYIYDERRPTFLRLTGYWLQTHWQDYPEFAEYVAAPNEGEGLSVVRAAFVVEGIDTRTPVAHLGGAIDVVGWNVAAGEVTAWLLARRDAPAVQLYLRAPGVDRAIVPGEGIYAPGVWRAGDVVKVRASRPPGSGLNLCADKSCVALTDGVHGAAPVAVPATAAAEIDRLVEREELDGALAAVARSGQPTRSIGAALRRRGEAAWREGQTGAAFADFRRALEADPSLSFVRRHVEELRPSSRGGYHPWLALRLSEAVRRFQLAPTAANLTMLVKLSQAAREPMRAVRAHLATRIAPADPVALAECYLDVGLPRQAAELVAAVTPDGEQMRARIERIARAADRRDVVERIKLAADAGSDASGALLWASGRMSSNGDVLVDVVVRRGGERRMKTIELGPRQGQSTAAVGTAVGIAGARLAIDVDPFSADFDSGRLDGWSATGTAFERQPYAQTLREQFGVQGDRYIYSTEFGQGRLTSPPLSADVAEVCVSVAGDPGSRIVLEDGATMIDAAEADGPVAKARCLKAGPAKAGRRIVIVDQSDEGRIIADDFTCFAHDGSPMPCAGAVRVSPLAK